ncbi:hypothetical protein FJT64_001066 [Amphibalanus amphitrite]|uniref:Apple domain-containing protein n=1 Tax=Amphibalanus amphitrite TaxID=1232801 RepID=A0A6A4VMW1_AMPAM|nr:hypothetical protein FJT64_001066 [Amphibalanus amphitrite]
METAWNSGRMDSGQRLQALTISSPQAGRCTCCALCHQETNCASLSFNSATSVCELYSSVASFSTLRPDSTNQWSYYVMPGRSETGHFCRQDSDCVTSGDFCRGRFCTSLDKVTCRTIADTFGSIRHFAVTPTVYGWFNGRPMTLKCWMTSGGEGFTAVLISTRGFQFDSTTLMEHNTQLQDGVQGQSLLGMVEDIRQSETDSTYRIAIWYNNNGGWGNLLAYDALRNEPVLSSTVRTSGWMNVVRGPGANWSPSMLWMSSSGSTLLTTNAADGQSVTGALATTDGVIHFDSLWVYIKE